MGIIETLGAALPGVLYSFVVVSIVMCIWAVLAVDLYRDVFIHCDDRAEDDPLLSVARTSRGKCFGMDYYGDFPTALYTMFQILTGESWSEACVRPILIFYLHDKNDMMSFYGAIFFFVMYICVCQI